MGKFTDYAAGGVPFGDDVLLGVDTHDTSMSAQGTNKQFAAAAVAAVAGTRGYRPADISYTDLIYTGQAAGGPTVTTSGTGSTGVVADTTDFVLGGQAVKVTSNGAGANTKITITPGAAINLTGKSLVVWVKYENLSSFLSGYPRFILGDTGLVNTYTWLAGSAAGQPWNLDGEWMRITLPFGTATATGAPSRSSLGSLIMQVFDQSAGPVTVHVGGVALMAETTLFPSGVLSLAFDDGYLTQFSTAKPLMDSYGYRGTAYLITETLWNHAAGFGSYMTLAQAQALEWYSGWEIGSHAFTAANHNAGYVAIGDAAALADMQAAKGYLISQGFRSPEQFAYPIGVYGPGTITGAQSVFGSGRSISTLGGQPDETFPPAKPHRLRSSPISAVSGIAAITTAITRAAANKEWVIATFHDIPSSASGNLQLSTANFTTLLASIQSSGITVLPVSEVLKRG